MKEFFKGLMSKKEDGAKAIVVEIVLIVVAVAVCVFFKDEVMSVITDLMSDVQSNIQGIF